MPYENITKSVHNPLNLYIYDNILNSSEPKINGTRKHVPTVGFKSWGLARGGFLVDTPVGLVTTVADTIIGIGSGLCAVGTLGLHGPTCKVAAQHIENSRHILSKPYMDLLRVLNPNAKITTVANSSDGIFHSAARDWCGEGVESCQNSRFWLVRQVCSRLTYVLYAIAAVITRVVDAIIGVFAAVLSFLFLGTFHGVNSYAYTGLQVTGIVNDLFMSVLGVINPGAPSLDNG